MYITPHYTDSSNGEGTPLANRYSLGRYITHPRGIHRCFVLMNISKLPDFRTSKQKRSKRLSIKIKVPALHPLVASAQELCKNRELKGIIKAFIEILSIKAFIKYNFFKSKLPVIDKFYVYEGLLKTQQTAIVDKILVMKLNGRYIECLSLNNVLQFIVHLLITALFLSSDFLMNIH